MSTNLIDFFSCTGKAPSRLDKFTRDGRRVSKKKLTPVDKPMREKYGGPKGMFSLARVAPNPDWQPTQQLSSIQDTLVRRLNMAVAEGTWGLYNTAVAHLRRCEQDTNVPMSLPLSNQQLLVYVGWLFKVRAVQSNTAAKYLSGRVYFKTLF